MTRGGPPGAYRSVASGGGTVPGGRGTSSVGRSRDNGVTAGCRLRGRLDDAEPLDVVIDARGWASEVGALADLAARHGETGRQARVVPTRSCSVSSITSRPNRPSVSNSTKASDMIASGVEGSCGFSERARLPRGAPPPRGNESAAVACRDGAGCAQAVGVSRRKR